ncbi:hypothetical protein RND81_12G008200 [Saponaria officinalis]|uniref:Calcineurin-like phosphoesterase domain-containing protein n=1 Tax=Saponaria officinalis TaxID=3572 RepID=A0AAW1H1R3_SAPOF
MRRVRLTKKKMRNVGKNNTLASSRQTILTIIIILRLVPLIRGSNLLLEVKQGLAFKIVLFADLHFGENAWTTWGTLQDVQSMHVMSCVLHQENPDLVVYLGDVITANNIATTNASVYWEMAISPTRERNIPWASVFGNHDDAPFEWPLDWFSQSNVPPLNCPSTISTSSGEDDCSFKGTTRLELMSNEIDSNKLSFSRKGPRNLWPGVSNYVLNISSSNNSQRPVAYLYFLDSGGGSYPEVISNAQAKWFSRTSREINPDARVPEIVFWHIPSRAYQTVAASGKIGKPCVGSINEENVAPQEAEFGIMKALEERPSVQAVFVGHNHGLDWCCPSNDLWLCFARHTGYGGYGNWARGARVLEIKEDPFSLKSWITMEDGSTHSHVVLSS